MSDVADLASVIVEMCMFERFFEDMLMRVYVAVPRSVGLDLPELLRGSRVGFRLSFELDGRAWFRRWLVQRWILLALGHLHRRRSTILICRRCRFRG
jgi:hypothetical protein